jgi:glutathione synthase/RimK-type ligase-like ATP-grasp enzyme
VAVFMRSGGKKIIAELKGLDRRRPEVKIELMKYKDLLFEIGQSFRVKNVDSRKSLHEFDMFYFLTRMRDVEDATLVAIYAKTKAITFIDSAALSVNVDSKIHQSAVLFRDQVRIPSTIYMRPEKWSLNYNYLKEQLGNPFIFKDNKGIKGRNNYLIKSEAEYRRV